MVKIAPSDANLTSPDSLQLITDVSPTSNNPTLIIKSEVEVDCVCATAVLLPSYGDCSALSVRGLLSDIAAKAYCVFAKAAGFKIFCQSSAVAISFPRG